MRIPGIFLCTGETCGSHRGITWLALHRISFSYLTSPTGVAAPSYPVCNDNLLKISENHVNSSYTLQPSMIYELKHAAVVDPRWVHESGGGFH